MAQQILNVSTPNSGSGDALRDASIKSNENFTELYEGKVDAVTGKGLSDNNLTDELITKINDIEAAAQVNIQSDWNENDILADAYIKNKPEQLFASLGYFDYADLTTQTTPISVAPDTQTLLTNDALGAGTDISQPPYAVNRVYEGSTANEFDFSQLSVGDSVDIRFHLKVTTSANNQLYHIDMIAGQTSPSEFTNRIFSSYVKTAGEDEQSFVTTFYVGSNDIKDNPAQVFITSTQSCTVEVVGWFVRVFRKNVNIVGILVEDDAPSDGLTYGRKDAEWVEVSGGGGGIPDAPNNANAYVRSALSWVIGYTKSAIDTLLSGLVPLTGTTVGNPITGTLESNAEIFLKTNSSEFIDDGGSVRVVVDYGIQFENSLDTCSASFTGDDTIPFQVTSSNPLSRGITGGQDFSENITDLDYTQKIYVDTSVEDLMPYAIPAPASIISFERPYEYADFTTPSSLTSITNDLTNARKGVVQKIYDNSLIEPPVPIGWVKLFGTYTPSETNIIYCVWAGGDRVEYWIIKATP